MNTLEGTPMTADAATVPIGSALRIAPGFVATAIDERLGIETTLEAHYQPDQGRYQVSTVVNRATHAGIDITGTVIRQVRIGEILQAAIPHCIAVTLDDADDPVAEWDTAQNLTATAGRIIPKWLAEQVVKRGNNDARTQVIQILYGTAALAGLPPLKAVSVELDVPHRTAGDWIRNARKAGQLQGMNYNVGRQADG